MSTTIDLGSVLAKHEIQPNPNTLVPKMIEKFNELYSTLKDQKESADSDESKLALAAIVEKFGKDETLSKLSDKVTAEIRAIVNEALMLNENVSYLLYGSLDEVRSEIKAERDYLRAKTNTTTKTTGIPADWLVRKNDLQELREAITDAVTMVTQLSSLDKKIKVPNLPMKSRKVKGGGTVQVLDLPTIPQTPKEASESSRPVSSRTMTLIVDGEDQKGILLATVCHDVLKVQPRDFMTAWNLYARGQSEDTIFPVNGHYVQCYVA